MLVERWGIFDLIVPINQRVVGPLIVEVKQAEVDDLQLEVAAAARMEMGKEADHLGS
jgi:hypothetical protein